MHRAALSGGASGAATCRGSRTRVGILYDIVALGRGDVLAMWNNSLDWHREAAGPWATQATVVVDLPQGLHFLDAACAAPRRHAAVAPSAAGGCAVGADALAELAVCADAVKLVTFREDVCSRRWSTASGSSCSAPTRRSAGSRRGVAMAQGTR
ncbi:MAG: hypothetical protein U0325_34655 [Polyangiales bacterium]